LYQLNTIALKFTYHGKCETGLWIFFSPLAQILPLEHVSAVWPKCGTFYFEDHLQERENVNKKIFRSYI
jgi:hypothetical protein